MKRGIIIALFGGGMAVFAAQDQPPPLPPPVELPAQTPADAAELAALRERLMQMAVRAGAIRTSLQNLKQQLANEGLGLRSDMAEAEQRLVLQMDTAQAALDRGNAADAKTNLGGAELNLAKLEKFLGR